MRAAVDSRQRCAKLMGDQRQKVVLELLRLPQSGDILQHQYRPAQAVISWRQGCGVRQHRYLTTILAHQQQLLMTSIHAVQRLNTQALLMTAWYRVGPEQ